MPTPLVLVVDDEAPIQRFVRAELEAQGYRVLTTGSGTAALERIEEDRPDLVLLDVMMPEMDGFETLRRLRQHSTVPVIMFTARGATSTRCAASRRGPTTSPNPSTRRSEPGAASPAGSARRPAGPGTLTGP